MLMETDQKQQIVKSDITEHHIDIYAMRWWVTSPFYDFCCF